MSILEKFIEETNAAETPEAIFKLFEGALNNLGYDRICYSLITDHPSLGLGAGHGVMKNYSETWMKHYTEKSYEKIDPVPKYCFSTNRPFSWEDVIEQQKLSVKEQRVMDEAQEAKLLDGIAVPIYGVNGEIAGVGLASSDGGIDINKNMLCKIRALAFQFHLAYTDKESSTSEKLNVHLTKREKEILLWAADGKTDPVIAEILGISYATVRFHMNNIFRKLNANERLFAVTKAIRHGLILPSYVSEMPKPIRLVR